jgi:hypothetical protein
MKSLLWHRNESLGDVLDPKLVCHFYMGRYHYAPGGRVPTQSGRNG